ncbi:MAG: NAD(+) diphosphatase [Maritimibacter sp.]
MMKAEKVAFAGGELDRQAHRRADTARIARDPASRILPLWKGRVLVSGDETTRLITLPPDHPALAIASGEQVFLGAADGVDMLTHDFSAWAPELVDGQDSSPGFWGQPQSASELPDLPADARFADLRLLAAELSPLEAETAATARGVLEWHRSHQFCATCGAASEITDGGWQRICPSCNRRHFPRTDPVVIMLVTRGNKLLMGRSKGWPEGFYSLLAGFMEPGEPIDAAVRREVLEESGIKTGDVRILDSQPWPFPASLMIGCHAEAISDEIIVDPTEMEDVLWITREEALDIHAGLHPQISPLRHGAIAQFLFTKWLADRVD